MGNPFRLEVKGLGLQRHDDARIGKGVAACTHAATPFISLRHHVELHDLFNILQVNSLQYLPNRRLGGHTVDLGPCGEEENPLSLPEIG